MKSIPYKRDEDMTTISEIAKEAGLGVTTVSRYLNNKPYVSEEKKRKIEAAIKKLDYTPNVAAKQLRTRKTKQIGVLVSRITNPFFAQLFDSIERLLHKYGYNAMIMQTYDEEDIERHFLHMLESHEVDAIMLASVENKDYVTRIIKKYPQKIILVNENIPEMQKNEISLDHYSAVTAGLNYLYKSNKRNIAYVTGGDFAGKGHGSIRSEAFIDFMNSKKLEINSNWIFNRLHSVEDGEKLANKICNLSKKPNAIFTNSDEVALGLIAGLKEKGIKIPEQVAVMGYDDQPFSKYAMIPISTIRQPVDELAAASVKLLLDKLQIKNEVKVGKMDLKVVIRQSA